MTSSVALRQRHVQGIQHQLGAQVVLDRPADDLVRPDIQHQGEVQEPAQVGM